MFSLSVFKFVTVSSGVGFNDQGQVIFRYWVYRGSSYDLWICVVIVTENDPQCSETCCSLMLGCSVGLVMKLW